MALTAPERPNNRISARPMTKGGVIIGRIDRTLIRRRARNFVRVTMSTKHNASSVAEDAVISPSCRVFQTMPP